MRNCLRLQLLCVLTEVKAIRSFGVSRGGFASARSIRMVLPCESCGCTRENRNGVWAYAYVLTLLTSWSSCPLFKSHSKVSSCPSTAAQASDVYRLYVGSGFLMSVRFTSRLTRKRLFPNRRIKCENIVPGVRRTQAYPSRPS